MFSNLYFGPKDSKLSQDYNFQSVFHLKVIGTHFLTFSHLYETVFESHDTFPTHSHFYVLALVMNPRLMLRLVLGSFHFFGENL